MLIEYQYALNS